MGDSGMCGRDAPIPKKRPIQILYIFSSADTDTFIFILMVYNWIDLIPIYYLNIY